MAIRRLHRGTFRHAPTPADPVPDRHHRHEEYVADPAALVDPFIGTAGQGNCFPGASMPFGMIQWSPDTPWRPPGGGYAHYDESITGFSLTHLSGPGCAVFGDVPILPTMGELEAPWDAAVGFSHDQEEARPGYYGVTLESRVTARLAVTTRAGVGEFGFPADGCGNVLIKLTDSATPVTAASAQIAGDDEICGQVTSGRFCGGPNTYSVFFAMRFAQPFTAYGTWRGTTIEPGARDVEVDGEPAGAYVSFDIAHGLRLQVRVGLSYVSEANARENLDAEVGGRDLDDVATDAYGRWNEMLRRINIAGGESRGQRIFYTALYHAMLHPNVCSDVNGEYLGFDYGIHSVREGHAQYANFSGWDIYRSQIPLIAMLAPEETSDAMQSMVDAHTQHGLLPKWSVANGESYIMVGDPAAPIIAGAYAFGARDFDTAAALSALLEQARQHNSVRPGLDYHEERGFLPIDGAYGCCNFYGPVSTQLEYDIADFAVAALAEALGDTTANDVAARANNWVNVFDASTGFLRPRLESGTFVPGFDPTAQTGFVEGNAWQYTPMVPFNVHALARAMGGDAKLRDYLDAFFGELNAERLAPHAWMGNEPCLGHPWLYDYAGAPYQTQHLVRRIQRELYTDRPDGLTGNDDLGTMSAWFVWSALGCFPMTPGVADLALNSPLFPHIRVHLAGGRELVIDAPEAAPDAPYVRGLELDGRPWPRAYLPASVIADGGHVHARLGTKPDLSWAADRDAAPPSYPFGMPPALGYLRPGYRIVVPAGGHGALTLGVRPLTDQPPPVNWFAIVPAGVRVNPGNGTLRLRPDADGPDGDGKVTLYVHAGHERGTFLVTLRFSAGGTELPDVLLEIVVE